MGRLRVVVLTGGTSAEREICLKSGAKVMDALDSAKYESVCVDLAEVAGARAADLAAVLFAPGGGSGPGAVAARNGRPDVVFIALHGGAGENGTVQGMLELLGIPYTGSGVLASALAINKIMSKRLFEHAGIPTPKWMALRRGEEVGAGAAIAAALGLPCVVKPACEGSTIGVTIVRRQEELPAALELAFRYGPEALAERFIPGTEITGPVLGNENPQVLPLIEIVPA
jgi:D-alanine-D-alanine ligase